MHSRSDFEVDISALANQEMMASRQKKRRILQKILKDWFDMEIIDFETLPWNKHNLVVVGTKRHWNKEILHFDVLWQSSTADDSGSFRFKNLDPSIFTRAPRSEFEGLDFKNLPLEFLEDLVEFMTSNTLMVGTKSIRLWKTIDSLSKLYIMHDLCQQASI